MNEGRHPILGVEPWAIVENDCLREMSAWPDGVVNCVVTSPPYWGLRDYGVEGQVGLEPTPEEYVEKMVAIFREARRVLADDGTLWLNLGDSYCADVRKGRAEMGIGKNSARNVWINRQAAGLKPKDLVGIPWAVAFALRADGWWLRSDIVWAKRAPMPESVTDRPTRSHEFMFLLSKRERYYYDADAVRVPAVCGDHPRNGVPDLEPIQAPGQVAQAGITRLRRHGNKAGADKQRGHGRRHAGFNDRWDAMPREEQRANGRNLRDVWTLGPEPFPDAHFAVMPTKLVEPCILAGCPKDGVVLDPFAGSGTVGIVARRHGRRFVGIELSATYAAMARQRIRREWKDDRTFALPEDAPLFAEVPLI